MLLSTGASVTAECSLSLLQLEVKVRLVLLVTMVVVTVMVMGEGTLVFMVDVVKGGRTDSDGGMGNEGEPSDG